MNDQKSVRQLIKCNHNFILSEYLNDVLITMYRSNQIVYQTQSHQLAVLFDIIGNILLLWCKDKYNWKQGLVITMIYNEPALFYTI